MHVHSFGGDITKSEHKQLAYSKPILLPFLMIIGALSTCTNINQISTFFVFDNFFVFKSACKCVWVGGRCIGATVGFVVVSAQVGLQLFQPFRYEPLLIYGRIPIESQLLVLMANLLMLLMP